MNRREFLSLCGLAAGSCLVPEAIARVIRDTCVLAEKPYLILPRNPKDTIYAYSGDGLSDFMLHIERPRAKEADSGLRRIVARVMRPVKVARAKPWHTL